MREFATGSTTSSSVIELMSNQASEMFQAVGISSARAIYAVLAFDVNST